MATDILIMFPMPPLEKALESEFALHRAWQHADLDRLLAEIGGRIRAGATFSPARPFDGALMDRLPKLEIIVNMGAGYESVDIDAARARGIVVTSGIGVNAADVAEFAFGLLIDTARGLSLGDRYVRDGQWATKGRLRPRPRLSGRKLGILGLGHIGLAIATRAEAFGMTVAYCNRRLRPELPYAFFAEPAALARAVDILMIAAPGGPETHHLVDRTVLDALGPDGILINIGRGTTVDEAALIAALAEGRLGGAGLDVFENEPEVPAALLALPNVVVQPHQAGSTHEGIAALVDNAVDNLRAHFAGQPVNGRVV